MRNRSKIKLGTTLYSLTNEFHGREYDFEQLIRKVAELDIGPGLEIVGFQSIRTFPVVDKKFVRWFRDLLDECGLEPSCIGLNADVNARRGDPMTLDEAIETQRLQLHSAHQLGFKIARVQGFILGPEAYERLLPEAEKLDVKMGLEIHAPHTVNDPQIMAYRDAIERLDSPYLGFIPDFSTSSINVPPTYLAAVRDAGAPEDVIEEALALWRASAAAAHRAEKFQRWRSAGVPPTAVGLLARMFGMFGRQPVEAWTEIMSRVIHVHGKFYHIDRNGSEPAIPFEQILPMFVDAGYEGYISSEWEGHVFTDDSGFENVVKQQQLSVRVLDAHVARRAVGNTVPQPEMIDETHDPKRQSWVESANGHETFPIQNLPFSIFSVADGRHRAGVAIGDAVLDLGSLLESGLLGEPASAAAAAATSGPALNDLAALPAAYRRALRRELSALLASGSAHRGEVEKHLWRSQEVRMHLPMRIGNYTDFFAGIHHARAASRIVGRAPDVGPNYKHVPIAYNGRASTVAVSGLPVTWPSGQHMGPGGEPVFGPSRALDYETEVAMWIAGSNRHGEPVPITSAGERLFGIGMLNDWSARDIQRWEAMPLGPFLAKTFHTTVSPWIVTVEALAPFRIAQPARHENDPPPLPYLHDRADQQGGAIAMEVKTSIRSRQMRDRGMPPHRLSLASLSDLYWTPAQMIAHHTSNGCDLLSGDLLGTGTISAVPPCPGGCLLEITENGATSIELPTGEQRRYLEPGDEITLEGHCRRDGFAAIGTGPAIGILVTPQA